MNTEIKTPELFPTGNRVIVKVQDDKYSPKTAIIGAEKLQEYFYAVAIEIGPDVNKSVVTPGTELYFPVVCGVAIMINGIKYHVIREHDIIVTIK